MWVRFLHGAPILWLVRIKVYYAGLSILSWGFDSPTSRQIIVPVAKWIKAPRYEREDL